MALACEVGGSCGGEKLWWRSFCPSRQLFRISFSMRLDGEKSVMPCLCLCHVCLVIYLLQTVSHRILAWKLVVGVKNEEIFKF